LDRNGVSSQPPSKLTLTYRRSMLGNDDPIKSSTNLAIMRQSNPYRRGQAQAVVPRVRSNGGTRRCTDRGARSALPAESLACRMVLRVMRALRRYHIQLEGTLVKGCALPWREE